jgi:hypothetical protein
MASVIVEGIFYEKEVRQQWGHFVEGVVRNNLEISMKISFIFGSKNISKIKI